MCVRALLSLSLRGGGEGGWRGEKLVLPYTPPRGKKGKEGRGDLLRIQGGKTFLGRCGDIGRHWRGTKRGRERERQHCVTVVPFVVGDVSVRFERLQTHLHSKDLSQAVRRVYFALWWEWEWSSPFPRLAWMSDCIVEKTQTTK